MRLQTAIACISCLIFNSVFSKALAQEETDSATHMLQEVVVSAKSTATVRHASPSTVKMDAAKMASTFRSFGEADPLRYLQLIPGVTAGSDFNSGLSIQGTSFSQTAYKIDNGATVFFPYRFGGLFSSFNASHLNDLSLIKGSQGSSASNRIGGAINLSHRKSQYRFQGNVGMTASGVAFDCPISAKWQVSGAARISYINLLYSELIKGNTSSADYNFDDFNACVKYSHSENTEIKANAFRSYDNLKLSDSGYGLNTGMRWVNDAYSLSYSHTWGKLSFYENASYSAYHNDINLDMPLLSLQAPASIEQLANEGLLSLNSHGPLEHAEFGYAYEHIQIKEQAIRGYGFGHHRDTPANIDRQNEVRAHAKASLRLAEQWHLALSAKATIIRPYFLFDPYLSLLYEGSIGNFSLDLGSSSQTLHQLGFSDVGLASNFWLGSGKMLRPTRSLDATLSYSRNLFGGFCELNAELYYKKVRLDHEYGGTIIDLINEDYNVYDYVITGKGYNCGVDLSLTKTSSMVTGMLAYAYGRARRRFPAIDNKTTNASTSPGHSFTAFASWKPTAKWEIGCNFNLHSGRPVTPVKDVYIVAENVLREYGTLYSSRLPLYHRLDLFATYKFTSGRNGKLHHSVNLSILNAYAHSNIETLTLNFNNETGEYYLKGLASLYKAIPSLSYSIEF